MCKSRKKTCQEALPEMDLAKVNKDELDRGTFPGCCSNNIIEWVAKGGDKRIDFTVATTMSFSVDLTTPLIYCATLTGDPDKYNNRSASLIDVKAEGCTQVMPAFEASGLNPNTNLAKFGPAVTLLRPNNLKTETELEVVGAAAKTGSGIREAVPIEEGTDYIINRNTMVLNALRLMRDDKEVLLENCPFDNIMQIMRVKLITHKYFNEKMSLIDDILKAEKEANPPLVGITDKKFFKSNALGYMINNIQTEIVPQAPAPEAKVQENTDDLGKRNGG